MLGVLLKRFIGQTDETDVAPVHRPPAQEPRNQRPGYEEMRAMMNYPNVRLGALTQTFTPGYSWCQKCQTTWVFVKDHMTQHSDSEGCAPLCEQCWAELTPETRLMYYREVFESWKRWGPQSERKWQQIHDAVMRGL